MAEIAGLATGTVALASLFSTVIDLFDRFELGRNYRKDYRLACTKIRLLQTRVIGWGGDLNVLAPGHEDETLRRYWSEVQDSVVESLLGIDSIFGDASLLADKYDISRAGSSRLPICGINSTISSDLNAKGLQGYLKHNSWLVFRKRTLWAVHDKQKLDGLIGDLEFFVTNLERVIERLQMSKRASNTSRPLRDMERAEDRPRSKDGGDAAARQDKESVPAPQMTTFKKFHSVKAHHNSRVTVGDAGSPEALAAMSRQNKEYLNVEHRDNSAGHVGDLDTEAFDKFHDGKFRRDHVGDSQ